MKVVYLNGNYYAELWSEINYSRTSGWGTPYGYPDDPDGGASRILNKAIFVSVGLSYYCQFPNLCSRTFGHPYVITIYSKFWHQFALNAVAS